MSNVHGLFTRKAGDDSDDDSDDHDESQNRYVGGVGDRGGGSGLAVHPNNNEQGDEDNRDSLFGRAESATPESRQQVRRTITMYRDGFVVDNGPYRRLDDATNAEFLRDLARGQTPRELLADPGTGGTAADGTGTAANAGNVTVGLVDKRKEEYVEEFRSFSGQGASLGSAAAAAGDPSVFDPVTIAASTAAASAAQEGAAQTSIQVRLPSGQRHVVRIALDATVADLAAAVVGTTGEQARFQLVAGFPPKPLPEPTATIQNAGLEGAQVSVKTVV